MVCKAKVRLSKFKTTAALASVVVIGVTAERCRAKRKDLDSMPYGAVVNVNVFVKAAPFSVPVALTM